MVETCSPALLRTVSCIALTPCALSAADLDQPIVPARHRALQEQDAAGGIGLDHQQVAHRHLAVAHVTGHAQPLEHAARRRRRADGTRGTMAVRLTVRLRSAREAVPLDASLEATTLGDRGHIYAVAGAEKRDVDALADLPCLHVVHGELAQILELAATLLEVALHGPVQLRVLDRAEAELHGIVAVGVGRLDLCDHARSGLDDGDALHHAGFVEALQHAEFLAEKSFDRHGATT